jgi:hypothetical protein
MRLLAIDFGTSNTVAALVQDGQSARTVTFDTSPLLPSAVFLAPDGTVLTGREALRQARLDPSRFEPNPKRRIDDGEMLLGDRVVPVVEVIAAVLRTVAAEVRRQLGGAMPDEVRMTHPANWGATRQNTLITAARLAGLGANMVLLPEPVAAAAQFTRLPGRGLPPGGTVAIYDLGGGTFDIAVVGRGDHPTAGESFHVLAEAGLPDLGGLDFDQAVLDFVGRSAAGVDRQRWQQLLHPADASSRRVARALAEDVRAAKEALSSYPQTEVALPDPFVDVHLTRTEFESLIRGGLQRSLDLMRGTLGAAGVPAQRLTGVFLVGGSSRIPLVARLIQEQLQVTPVALDQPETAVALGALLVPVQRDGQRTVAMADPGPARPYPGAPSGPLRPAPVSGPLPPVHPAPAPARSRTPLVAGIGVAVVVVIVVVVLAVTGVFSGWGSTAGSSTPVSSTAGSSTPVSSSAPVSGSGGSSGGATTGLGPNKAFTAAEVSFLGPSIAKLTNCTVITDAYNAAVTVAGLQAARTVRCELPASDAGSSITSRVLMYLVTAQAGDAGRFLDQVKQNAKKDPDIPDLDQLFTGSAESGRYVSGYDIPALGVSYGDTGVSVLAWDFDGQPLVGVLAAQDPTLPKDLQSLWSALFQPR